MNPHLQLQCGPMLRYDTVDASGIYHAFAMIVSADAGSDYTQTPYLTYRFTPAGSSNISAKQHSTTNGTTRNGSNGGGETVKRQSAEKIWTYHALAGPNSFWRMKIEIPLSDIEMKVNYSVNGGRELSFYVPARTQNMRWVGHSCNGFSAGKLYSDSLGVSRQVILCAR